MNDCSLYSLVSTLQSHYAHLLMRQVAGVAAYGPGLLVVDRRAGLVAEEVLAAVYFMPRAAFLSRALARSRDEAPHAFAAAWETVLQAMEACRAPHAVVVAFVSEEESFDVSAFGIEAPETLHPAVLALPVVLN